MADYTWEILKGRLEERWARARLRALREEARRPRATASDTPTFYFWRKDSS